jgi:hypothetical protein
MPVLFLLVAMAGSPAEADTTYLYKTLLVRAAPAALLEVIDLYRERARLDQSVGEPVPFMARHRQGDQWDLILVYPMESFAAYYAAERRARRSQGDYAAIDRKLAERIAWREETFMNGPGLHAMQRFVDQGTFWHIEMFVALPGKRAALLRQREMENDFYRYLNRPQNLIFTRAGGSSWDAMTIGVYEDFQQLAAGDTIPSDLEDAAARRAGFEGAARIGTYLRTLIQYHHDTLAGVVR